MVNMFGLAKFTLLALLLVVTNGQDKPKEKGKTIEKIVSGIDKTSTAIQSARDLAQSESHGLKDALTVIQSFSELGAVFFPGLGVFASSIGLLNGLIIGGDSPDQRIINELTEIKESISHVELMISNLVPQIRQDMIKQRFIASIQNKVNQLQRIYDEFAQLPDRGNQEALVRQCKTTNGMKTVLTDIHTEITRGAEGNYNELLNGGIRKEMMDTEKWSHAFIALYMQASMLRSACFPLMHTEHDWENTLDFQVKIHQKELEEITETAKQKLNYLKENAVANGRNALPEWLNDNWTTWGWELMRRTQWYLNDNFDDGTGTKWNVIVVPSSDVNYRFPALLYVSKTNGLSLIAGHGKIKRGKNPEVCDESYPFVYKRMTCFYVAGMGLSYHGRVTQYWDSHEYDPYE